MRIDAIDVYLVRNSFTKPFRTAFGEEHEIHTVLVNMTSDGQSAWSEACPLQAPTYSPEFGYGVYLVVTRFLAPLVLHRSFDNAAEINAAMSAVKGNPFAKSALEIAWWTLESKIRGIPLHRLLGGKDREVAAGADFGVQDNIDTLLSLIEDAVANGYPRIKLKVMRGWDIDMLRAVRSAYPKQTLHVDCNSGYTLEDLPLFRKMDEFELAMIEQPLFHTDIQDHARLQASICTPVCLDESVTSPRLAREAIEKGACRYINIKPGRVGGLHNALQINAICEEAGVGCWIGGMLETSVGAGICIELATISNIVYPSDLFPSSRFFDEDISNVPIEHSSPGKMAPTLTPGNRYTPDKQKLQEHTLYSVHL